MNDKEEIEVSRDWSAKNLNFTDLEHHQEVYIRLHNLIKLHGMYCFIKF